MLADSVGLALLVVLDTLTPAERLAFVLHDMFVAQMGGISEVRGAAAAAATFSGRAKGARLALIDGIPGMMWAPGGQVRVVFDFIISGGKIVAIEMIADPEHLAQLEVVPA